MPWVQDSLTISTWATEEALPEGIDPELYWSQYTQLWEDQTVSWTGSSWGSEEEINSVWA